MNQALMEHILDVSRRLAEIRSLTPLLERIIGEALDLVGAERGCIVLPQPDNVLGFRIVSQYNGQQIIDADDQISRSVLAQMLTKCEPLILDDAMNEPYFSKEESVTLLKPRSLMCVPLIVRDKVIGALYVENRTAHKRFSEADLSPFVLFAKQVAVTIENAVLNDELEARVTARTQEREEERILMTQHVAERTAELSTANAELMRAARLKDEFLATISHELRTPLTAILNLTEALQLKIYGDLNAKQEKALQNITKSGHHLLTLINDVLDLAKIEAGALELEVNPVAVRSICQASLELVQEQATKKRVQLILDYDNAVSIMLTDERRLKQILVNLLDNAIKFTPDNGRVGLQIVGASATGIVYFVVWDTGIGISLEQQQLLFQPFVQIDTSLTRKYGGTGLGLVIVKRIVDVQGGHISVESKPGQGSRFIVGLPWRKIGASAA